MWDMTKTLLKSFWISLFLLLPSASETAAQAERSFEREGPPDMEFLMSVRERFVYNVRYSFINLGQIEVELLPDSTYDGRRVQRMRTIMRSGSGVPFVRNRNVHYNNLFSYNDEGLYSHIFWRDDLHDDEYRRSEILFDRDRQLVYFFERGEPCDTLTLEDPASGGDIIFFYSRLFAGIEEPYTLPVYISRERGEVTASSSPDVETRSYEAFPEPIETYRSEGVADIDGPFGFTGRFRSWFSTDDRRIPVEAHVRVLFGNVRITLVSYEQLEERTEGAVPTARTRP